MPDQLIDDNFLNDFSGHLFWDTDLSELDSLKYRKFIIKKVLQFGLFSDWKKLIQLYGINTIVEISKNIRDLDKKTVSFLSVISGVPKNEFSCFTITPLTPKHWDF